MLEINKDIIWAPHKINYIEKQSNVIYSDNHLMQAKFNWVFQNKGKIKRYSYNSNNHKKLLTETEDVELLKTWQSNKSFQRKYTEWNSNILRIAKKCIVNTKQGKAA